MNLMKMNRMAVKTVSAITLAAVAASAIAPSTTAPGAVSNPPQFIVLGSDDNTNTEALNWMVDVLANYKNKNDNSDLRMSFYSNTKEGAWTGPDAPLVRAHKYAYANGHEVTNHTETHVAFVEGDVRLSKEAILSEMQIASDRLTNMAGIPKTHQFGFRTPYLKYSDSTFAAIQEFGFLYDCSISEGNQQASGTGAGSYYWPYTLGTASSENQDPTLFKNGKEYFNPSWLEGVEYVRDLSFAPGAHVRWSFHNKTNNTPVRAHSSIWQLPCYNYNAPEPLAAQLNAAPDYWAGRSNEIGGLDYNMWADTRVGGFAFDKQQTLDVLKETLDKKYAGNRTPMTIGIHSQYYFQSNETTEVTNDDGSVITVPTFPNMQGSAERQWVFEEFIKYAVSKSDVFFVSGDMVIRFMKNPVSAAQFNPETYAEIGVTIGTNQTPTGINLSNNAISAGVTTVGTLSTVDDGLVHTYSIVSGSFSIAPGTNVLTANDGLAVGPHPVVIKTTDEGGLSLDVEFTITVTEPVGPITGTEVLNVANIYPIFNDAVEGTSAILTKEMTADTISKATMAFAVVDGNDDSWAKVEVALDSSMANVTAFQINYSSSVDMRFVVPMDGVTSGNGQAHFVVLSKNETTKTIVLDDFGQPNWVSPKIPLEISKVKALSFELNNDVAGSIDVTSIVIAGYPVTVIDETPVDTLELMTSTNASWGCWYDTTNAASVVLDSATEAFTGKGTFTNPETAEYAGMGTVWIKNTDFNFEGVKRIEIKYTATADFVLNIPMKGVTDLNGSAHRIELPAASNEINVGVYDSRQHSYPAEVGITPLDLLKVEGLEVALADLVTSGEITIQSLRLIYKGDAGQAVSIDTPLNSAVNVNPMVSSITSSRMNLSVPTAGVYNVKFYSVNGRLLKEMNSNLTSGFNNVNFDGTSLSSSMVLVQISGNGVQAVSKAMIK